MNFHTCVKSQLFSVPQCMRIVKVMSRQRTESGLTQNHENSSYDIETGVVFSTVLFLFY